MIKLLYLADGDIGLADEDHEDLQDNAVFWTLLFYLLERGSSEQRLRGEMQCCDT